MIIFHIFCWAGAEHFLAPQAMRLIEACNAVALDYKIVHLDQHNARISESVRIELGDLGCEYRVTTFNRGGNLNGAECVRGIVGEMLMSFHQVLYGGNPSYARWRASECVLVKLDPDTLVVDALFLKSFQGSGKEFACFDDRGSAYGMIYAIRGYLLPKLFTHVSRVPMAQGCPEDVTIGHRSKLLAGESHVRLWPMYLPVSDDPGNNGPHGIMSAYNYHLSASKRYNHLSVITLGNLVPQGITKEDQARLMATLALPQAKEQSESSADAFA